MRRSPPALGACLLFVALSLPSSAEAQVIPGLPAGAPQDVGMSLDSLAALTQIIDSTPPADFRGLVVIKDGLLVYEAYFHTFWRETIHDVRSAGKSITSLLLGIAIDKGYVASADQRLVEFFADPDLRPGTADDFDQITLRHLLTMSSGLDANDDDDLSPGRTGRWLTRTDWLDYILSLPMRAAPGSEWVYTDVSPVLIGGIVEQSTGMRLHAFARTHLFDPLGIREVYWYTGPGGQTGAMGNLYLTTLDFAKLGLLMLNEGVWHGQRVVSSDWVRESTRQHTDISGTNPFSTGYGFMWYRGVVEAAGETHDLYFASGNGGNVLFVVPSLELVVATTSSAYGQSYGHTRSHNVFHRVLSSINGN